MKHTVVLPIFAAAFVFLASQATVGSPYEYDEADYMHIARLGWRANFTDTPTLPIGEFFRQGMSRGRDASQKLQLSEQIREADDVVFYRHWNGPLYIYWLEWASKFAHDERAMRLFTMAFPLGSLLTIYWGCLWLLGGARGGLAGMLSAALFAGSTAAVRSTELAPHQGFACCLLISLMLLAKTVAEGKRIYFYYAVVSAALSCCFLEVGFVTVATVLVCGLVERKNLAADGEFALRSVGLFFATALAGWPGAILKLSFLKGYAFMAYISLWRRSPWGQESLLQTWKMRIFSAPVGWVIIVLGVSVWIVIALLRRNEIDADVRSSLRIVYPFAVFALLMMAVTLRVTTGAPRYALVFEPSLDVLAGGTLACYLLKYRRESTALVVAGVISLVLVLEAWVNLERHPAKPDAELTSLLAFVQGNHLESSKMLVPQAELPTLHYYFPRSQLRGYVGEAPEISQRWPDEAVIYPGSPIRYEAPHRERPDAE